MQFDTLDYAKRLETAGVPAPQAEAQAKALGDVLGKAVAFPGDLVALESNLALKLGAVENRLETKIEAVRAGLAKIDAVGTQLETKIDAVRTELKLDVGGRIDTLKWMFVALDVGILVRLLFVH
jgi:hypothetical protein